MAAEPSRPARNGVDARVTRTLPAPCDSGSVRRREGSAMRLHHLNCILTCPLGGRLMDGRTATILQRGHLACHCLLIETADSLVLVDTGFGLRDVADPPSRLSRFFLALVRPEFREEMTAIRQI